MTERLRAATVGTFDGVHKGHRLVLDNLRNEARSEGLEPIAITFDRHPLELIAPERAPGFLTPVATKLRLLEEEGVRPLVMAFNEQMRRQTAYEWMRRLHDEMGVRVLVVGYDNTFGSDGLALSVSDYEALGEVTGIRVVEAPVAQGISSSAVRKAVAAGDVARAGELLGRPYRIEGTVRNGNRLGSQIGFPTANIATPRNQVIPAEGVYAGIATLSDGRRFKSAVNIGRRPTIGDLDAPLVEAHLIGFEGNLYGQTLTVDLFSRIRDEEKFPSLEALAARLKEDVETAAGILKVEG